jgi:hypothetical protein
MTEQQSERKHSSMMRSLQIKNNIIFRLDYMTGRG